MESVHEAMRCFWRAHSLISRAKVACGEGDVNAAVAMAVAALDAVPLKLLKTRVARAAASRK